jgi:hypothetical protein
VQPLRGSWSAGFISRFGLAPETGKIRRQQGQLISPSNIDHETEPSFCERQLFRRMPGSLGGHGDDLWTQRAADSLREIFEKDCEVFFVFNGTAANSLSLASLCQPYHSILCHELAHVETSECGAP